LTASSSASSSAAAGTSASTTIHVPSQATAFSNQRELNAERDRVLRNVFKHAKFKSPTQKKAVDCVLKSPLFAMRLTPSPFFEGESGYGDFYGSIPILT
jgi:hypothetical protein